MRSGLTNNRMVNADQTSHDILSSSNTYDERWIFWSPFWCLLSSLWCVPSLWYSRLFWCLNRNCNVCTSIQALRRSHKLSVVARKAGKITWALLAVCICFALLNSPAKIYLFLYPVRLPDHVAFEHAHDYFRFRFVWTLALFAQSLTNVINFFIYSVANEVFRKQAKAMLVCRSRHSADMRVV